MKKLLFVIALISSSLVINAQNKQGSNKKNTTQSEQNREAEDDSYGEDDTQQNNTSAQDVPSKAKETLKSKYPEASNTEWTKEGNDHEAEFTVGESEYTVLFDNSGKWISTKVDNLPMNEVPKKVKDGLKRSEFKSWDINEVDFIESPEKSIYKVEVKNGMRERELSVDKNGTILKKGDKASM